MAQEPDLESEALVLDRKRALEEDDSELIVTDHPELFEDADQLHNVTAQVVHESLVSDTKRNGELAKDDKTAASVQDRKPFKRSKPEEKSLPSAILSLRLLIPTNYSGLIIGKSGATIAGIKERSDAKVVMSEMITAAPDRILTMTGMPEEVAQAVYEVARILIRAENQQYKTDEKAYQKLTMRFLIPDEIVGAVIGKKAVKVKEIQKLSNSRVSAEQGLLLDSTERKMNVTGDADNIRAAVVLISQIILEFPASVAANIPFRPRPYLDSNPIPNAKSNTYAFPQIPYGQSSNFNAYAMPQQNYYMGQEYSQSSYMPPEYSQPSYMAHQYLNSLYSQHSTLAPNSQAFSNVPNSKPYANTNAEHFQNSANYPTQTINVPSQFVGALIGRAGRHINEMRRVSRCEVEVVDLAPGVVADLLEERQFKITGPPQQIAIALDMIGVKIESEKKRIAKYGK